MYLLSISIVLYAVLFFCTKGEQEISIGTTATIVILNVVANLIFTALNLGPFLSAILGFGILTILICKLCNLDLSKSFTVASVYTVVSIVLSFVGTALGS